MKLLFSKKKKSGFQTVQKRFGIKIYKLCDSNVYTYAIKIYLRKAKWHKVQDLTPTHAKVTELTQKLEEHSHRLYMDNFFSPPLFDDLATDKLCDCEAEVLHKFTSQGKKKIQCKVSEMRGRFMFGQKLFSRSHHQVAVVKLLQVQPP
jgi:hypothetical protein